jgi:hypothetical protein
MAAIAASAVTIHRRRNGSGPEMSGVTHDAIAKIMADPSWIHSEARITDVFQDYPVNWLNVLTLVTIMPSRGEPSAILG